MTAPRFDADPRWDPYRRRYVGDGARGGPGRVGVAILLVLAVGVMLISLTLYQLTAEGPAKDAHRRAVAALTEIDALIDGQYDDLQTRAESAQPGESLQLRDFPLAIELRPDEVRGASRDDLRRTVLARSADRLYDDGTGALRETAEATDDAGYFSAAGFTDTFLGFLTRRNHAILAVLTFVTASICATLAAWLASLCRGFARLAAVAGALLVASLPIVLAGVLLRLSARSGGDTEYIERELLEIAESLAWAPIRNGLAFTALGALLLIVGVACAAWTDRRGAPRSSAAMLSAREGEPSVR